MERELFSADEVERLSDWERERERERARDGDRHRVLLTVEGPTSGALDSDIKHAVGFVLHATNHSFEKQQFGFLLKAYSLLYE